MVSNDKSVATRCKETAGYLPTEGVHQGRTDLGEVKTSLQKVWFSPLASREIVWMGHAGAGLGLLVKQEATLGSRGAGVGK